MLKIVFCHLLSHMTKKISKKKITREAENSKNNVDYIQYKARNNVHVHLNI